MDSRRTDWRRRARRPTSPRSSSAQRWAATPRSTVANFETGVTVPRELVVREWARLTDTPEWWLWGPDAPEAVVKRLAHTSGWTYGSDVIDLADWERRSDPIYVPGQIDLFDPSGLAQPA